MSIKSSLKFRASNSRRILGTSLSLLLRHRTIYPTGAHLYNLDGVKLMLDLSAPMQRVIYRQGSFEPDLTRLLQKVLRSGEVFIDIGANFGWHTLSLLVRRPDILNTYAFE